MGANNVEEALDSVGRIGPNAARWIVDRLSPDALFTCLTNLGTSGEAFFKGFKVSRQAAGRKVVRARLASELPRIPELAATLLEHGDGPWKHWRHAVACLDESWLAGEWRNLVRHYGPDVVAALAVDVRPEVRKRGWRALGRDGYWGRQHAGGGEAAEAEVPAELVALFAAADVAKAGGSDAEMPDAKAHEKAVARLEREREESEQQRERTKQKNRELQKALAELREQMEAEQKEAKRRVRGLAAESERLAAESEREVALRVDEFRRSMLGLTPEFRELCAKWAPAAGRSLAERIAAALSEQRQLNEKHGTLASIRDEISKLEQAEDRIRRATRESVVVVPGLDALCSEIAARLTHLRDLVGGGGGGERPPELATLLMNQIAACLPGADGDKVVDDIRLLLSVPAIGRVLSESWIRRIREEADSRRATTDRVLRAMAELPVADMAPGDRREAFPREMLSFDREFGRLAAGHKIHLFVDGYNVTKTVPFFQAMEESQDLSTSRRKLCEMCRTKSDRFASFELVFDGSHPITTRETWGNVTVVFAAHKRQDQNADDCIVDLIREQQAENDEVWLVSNDYGLRARLRRHCTAFASTMDFYNFLAG